MDIDWVKISTEALRGVVDLVIGGIGAYVVYQIQKRRDKRKGAILLELSRMRREGVVLRNEGHKEMERMESDDWVSRVQEFDQALIDKAKELSPAEGEKLAILDRVPVMQFSPGVNKYPLYRQKMQNFSERLRRLELLLDKYLTP